MTPQENSSVSGSMEAEAEAGVTIEKSITASDTESQKIPDEVITDEREEDVTEDTPEHPPHSKPVVDPDGSEKERIPDITPNAREEHTQAETKTETEIVTEVKAEVKAEVKSEVKKEMESECVCTESQKEVDTISSESKIEVQPENPPDHKSEEPENQVQADDTTSKLEKEVEPAAVAEAEKESISGRSSNEKEDATDAKLDAAEVSINTQEKSPAALVTDMANNERTLDSSPVRKEEDHELEESRDVSASDTRTKDSSLITAFRDFFLAAFSDNYQDAYCCGGGEILNGALSYPMYGGKVAPDQEGLRAKNSGSSYHADLDITKAGSNDSSRRRRKKPLAIAVGYNYAKAMDGQPVVITIGNKKPSPLDPVSLTRASSRSSRNTSSSRTSRSRSSRQGKTPSNASVQHTATGDSQEHNPRLVVA